MKPHTPLFAPAGWAERYPIASEVLPEVGDLSKYPSHVRHTIEAHLKMDPHLRRAHRAGYHANLAFVDHCIGRVLNALDELGLAEDTVVVYTSDHGEMDGDHGLFQKFCMFEPAVRVPLIVSAPGQAPAGKTCDALTEYIGLYPTLAELAGVPPPQRATLVDWSGAPNRIDARSFAPLVRDPSAPGPDAVFSEYGLRGGIASYMVRTRHHKYVLNDGATDELYDLDADPGEHCNRADDTSLRGLATDLRARVVDWFDPKSNPFRPSTGNAS
jgi:arylsulfatase A-like enzyme